MNDNNKIEEQLELEFGDNFLKHHAGQIITDQRFAIIELVANSWDAGSDFVSITWKPEEKIFQIEDNGIGMTKDEFLHRWRTLSYNRLDEQGKEVIFPKNVRHRDRVAFGRNGIGRHAMFCFSDFYEIITIKDNELTHARITKSKGNKPFDIKILETKPSSGHGTTLKSDFKEITLLPEQKIMELIGSSFIADPEFKILVNKKEVQTTSLEHLCKTSILKLSEKENIVIKRYETEKGRTIKHNGVAWWVNTRLVGSIDWKGIEGSLLDGRSPIAKQYTYIVIADVLSDKVKPDWSGFYTDEYVVEIQKIVYRHISDDLGNLFYETRRDRKKEVLYNNRTSLNGLSAISKHNVSTFIDEIQTKCPTFGNSELQTTVEVLAKFEKSRSGYALLEKLAKLNPNDIDSLNQLLDEWTVEDAKKVLNELYYRLDLIKKLDELVENHTTDELHDLQPLFERGLWIFGPEFESISYISNRSLSTIVRDFFKTTTTQPLEKKSRRPDFVILPEASIGVYANDKFDDKHEVIGFGQVIIVELKKGGFEISDKEINQALSYAKELRKTGKVDKSTKIICYVLGSSISELDNEIMKVGEIEVIPRRYNTILKQANARTFNLLNQLEMNDKIKQFNEETNLEISEIFPDNFGTVKLFENE